MRQVIQPLPMAFEILEVPCGWVALIASDQGLYEIILAANRAEASGRLKRYAELPEAEDGRRWLAAAEAIINGYFTTRAGVAQLKFDWRGLSDFSVKVLNCLSAVPRGKVVSYGELARRAGSPGAARAVGRIMAGNPFPIVIPCHRVLGAGGKMIGYSGGEGIATKRWLLKHEGYPTSI